MVLMNKKINILIVDDNVEFANLLKDFINSHDDLHVVGVARDGVEAIEMIKMLTPDVVILDIIMPNLDGLGVLEKFHSLKYKNKPQFIILSAISQDIFIRKAISLGAEYYIIKPFDASVLITRIRQIFREKYSSCILNNKNILPSKYIGDSIGENNVEAVITDLLHKSGISPHMSGYKYLKEAVMYTTEHPEVMNSVTKILYPYIANKFDSTPQKVERAMRSAIARAWKKVDSNTISSLFGRRINLKKKPSNSEFIALLADKIRVRLK